MKPTRKDPAPDSEQPQSVASAPITQQPQNPPSDDQLVKKLAGILNLPVIQDERLQRQQDRFERSPKE